MNRARIIVGDCIERLAELDDASVDAIVTDPPYGLEFMGKEWDRFGGEVVPVADTQIVGRQSSTPFAGGDQRVRYGQPGSAFGAWCELWAAECLRVLKPGGHMLAFGGTRTWHRLACAIEDAGFEIRDSIAWLYGSGFPKSLDVSKAIDKRRSEDDAPTRAVAAFLLAALTASPLTQREAEERLGLGFNSLCNFIQPNRKSFGVPRWDLWQDMKATVGFGDEMDAEVWRLNGRKGTPGDAWLNAEVVGVREDAMAGWSMDGTTKFVTREDKAPATADAAAWQGWGTALKPAHEPVVVARKPLQGTVAANVLAWGTGALNIDATRIEGQPRTTHAAGNVRTATGGPTMREGLGLHDEPWPAPAGRWPANVILDETQAAHLDQQSGNRPGMSSQRDLRESGRPGGFNDGGMRTPVGERQGFNDTGGASRFFYVPKAPTRERPKVDGVAHPTVKPLTLIRYLCRLVTPPDGLILDPFAGSGTTIEAALLEGFRVIGIEREAEYLPLIEARLARVADNTDTALAELAQPVLDFEEDDAA